MGQYFAGTATFTNGDQTVSFSGADLLAAGIQPGMPVTRKGSGVTYVIASVDAGAGTVELAASYAGLSESDVPYVIALDRTAVFGFPVVAANDLDATSMLGHAMPKIEDAILSRAAGNHNHDGQYALLTEVPSRNILDNGGMQIWQRGLSGAGGMFADRWHCIGTDWATRSDWNGVPVIHFGNNVAAYPLIEQRKHARNVSWLEGRTCTLSFKAKNVTGSSILYVTLDTPASPNDFAGSMTNIGIHNFGTPVGVETEYTATFANLDASVANGLRIRIIRDNASASTTEITDVSFTPTAEPVPFLRPSFEEALAACLPYYRKSYCYSDTPGSIVTDGGILARPPTTNLNHHITHPPMIAPGAVTVYSPETGQSGKMYNGAQLADYDAASAWVGETGFTVYNTVLFPNNEEQARFHWVHEAEL